MDWGAEHDAQRNVSVDIRQLHRSRTASKLPCRRPRSRISGSRSAAAAAPPAGRRVPRWSLAPRMKLRKCPPAPPRGPALPPGRRIDWNVAALHDDRSSRKVQYRHCKVQIVLALVEAVARFAASKPPAPAAPQPPPPDTAPDPDPSLRPTASRPRTSRRSARRTDTRPRPRRRRPKPDTPASARAAAPGTRSSGWPARGVRRSAAAGRA